jgi:hypothetical protein
MENFLIFDLWHHDFLASHDEIICKGVSCHPKLYLHFESLKVSIM